jgi:hypothetical protein
MATSFNAQASQNLWLTLTVGLRDIGVQINTGLINMLPPIADITIPLTPENAKALLEAGEVTWNIQISNGDSFSIPIPLHTVPGLVEHLQVIASETHTGFTINVSLVDIVNNMDDVNVLATGGPESSGVNVFGAAQFVW